MAAEASRVEHERVGEFGTGVALKSGSRTCGEESARSMCGAAAA